MYTQVPEQQEAPQKTVTFTEVYLKYDEKLNEVVGRIQSFQESDEDVNEDELYALINKAKKYVAILEEINLKKKLTLKRSLNLCLYLLKMCRVNVNDMNLVDICVTLIQPALQETDDRDNFLLALESIG